MVIEGDFVPGSRHVEVGSREGLQRLHVPVDQRLTAVVWWPATSIVMFKDNPAARALVKYLATPAGGDDLVK